MSLQLKWKYMQRTFTKVVTLMGLFYMALRGAFFPALFRVEEFDDEFIKP